ncbi:glycine zipper 2TM domain-containing protein [Halomonas sp. 18H]|uniref:glycine zipper 2TM domain-containing protein n=1 Tax=Halomonas almeriensis TaxID=308163 RepID=UPI00222F6A85|nr:MULTISPECIES: glycine zipper 2TM domain-containing protein [Halomonas]MCW4149148.1 glycine zipper 2TM domain-containing protein [Halomonas sp. 18H]MDN3552302.1 glycine zipper 2TM domain-containing protein [Halomonas almeriensis]
MKRLLPVLAVSVLTLAGCANSNPYSGNVYSGNDAKTAQSVTIGNITALRPVQIQADSRAGGILGGGGGAIIGGLLGSQVGGGSGRQLATVAGAIGGAVAGSKIEESSNMIDAVEIEVRKNNGEQVVVVQRAERQQQFQVGQKVRLIGTGRNVSVAPY